MTYKVQIIMKVQLVLLMVDHAISFPVGFCKVPAV